MKFYHNPWFNFYCIGDSTIADNKEICLRSITANDLGKAIGFSLIAYPFTSSYSYSCNPVKALPSKNIIKECHSKRNH